MNGIIVLGGHVQGYGIIRVYGFNKIPIILIDSTRFNIARHSKYCKKFYKKDYEEILEFLLDKTIIEKYGKWLIIPTDDYHVKILSTNKKILSEHYNILIDDWAKIKLFYDKTNSYPLVEKLGIPVPKTMAKIDKKDLPEIAKNISYPCIIKPAIMKDFLRIFHKKVIFCQDYKSLLENYELVTDKIDPSELLIQEIIDGSNINQFSVGLFSIDGQVQNFIVAQRARQHPIDFGNATTYARTVVNETLKNYALRIIKEVKLSGVFEVEFKFDDKDKKYKFLEINPRTWKWHLIAEQANVPLLMSMYNYVYHKESLPTADYKEAAWSDFYTDFSVKLIMKKRKIYEKYNIKNKISAVWNKSDSLPFIMQGMYLPYLIFKRR
jgi:predicted ATP-grasp superfamily ATP-dependent carboligase